MNYSAGPWKAERLTDGHFWIRSSTLIIAEISGEKDVDLYAASEADANLIAAAPDLLEAGNDLVDALLTVAPSTMYPEIVQYAITAWLQAIAKAEGRES